MLATVAVRAQDIDITEGEDESVALRIEEVLTGAGQVRLDTSIAFTARAEERPAGLFDPIPLGPGVFLDVPSRIGAEERESETLIGSATLRYGVTDDIEIFGRGAATTSRFRTIDLTGTDVETSESTFSELAFGASWRVLEDERTPALIVFADGAAVEAVDAEGDEFVHGRTFNFGLTSYRVIDPIVLTLTTGYRLSLPRTVGGRDIDPGDVLYVNPGVAFAVNDVITLTGGVNLRHRIGDTIDGAAVGTARTRADLEFGLGYAASENLTLRASTRTEVVAGGGFTAILSASYLFGN